MLKSNYSSIETIIKIAKKGGMFILVDDEKRENEGDLVISTSDTNSKNINFMAKFGRGLICLALDSLQAKRLNLSLMSPINQSRNKTAFTISIEAKKGISTGIFSSGILDWHANLNGLDRADGVALQGYEGCENTSTSYLNTNLAYNDLDDAFKKELEGVHCEYEYTPEVWAKGLSDTQLKMMKKDSVDDKPYKMWLLQQNVAGVKGLYFYTNNKCKIITKDETLFQRLYDHMFQDKYVYQHWYEPGDIVLMDQLLTLHKRDQNDPEILAKRVLHRITFRISNYNNFIENHNKIVA